ncbi:MAG: chromosome partitioning protein ParA [Candidatus Puniceispirillum sp.]|nr:chromosome partitioning protein ParA [Candidatus Pelagibacter sp.]MBA4283140.1 chromosome partitioning protein ParA [Candidatus Puniceispirillum sp.]
MLEDIQQKILNIFSETNFWKEFFQTPPTLSSIKILEQKIYLIFQIENAFVSNQHQIKFEEKIQRVIDYNFELLIGYEVFKKAPVLEKKQLQSKRDIVGVEKIYLVASGKGGVGKSTTSLQLALGLQQKGLKVGLLDADIYGPSLSTLTGTFEKPDVTTDKKIIPIQKNGLALMSLSFLVSADKATIWRGPMAQSALLQLLFEVEWAYHGDLDVLIIDTPPGTGDIHLSLIQQLVIDGVILVTTPQRLAVIDAVKAQDMFLKLNIPILGYIENMAYVVCSKCDHHQEIFCNDRKNVVVLKIPKLASIPHIPKLMKDCDEGKMFLYSQYLEAINTIF